MYACSRKNNKHQHTLEKTTKSMTIINTAHLHVTKIDLYTFHFSLSQRLTVLTIMCYYEDQARRESTKLLLLIIVFLLLKYYVNPSPCYRPHQL